MAQTTQHHGHAMSGPSRDDEFGECGEQGICDVESVIAAVATNPIVTAPAGKTVGTPQFNDDIWAACAPKLIVFRGSDDGGGSAEAARSRRHRHTHK